MNLTPPLDPSALEQSFALFRLARMVYVAAELDIAGYLAKGPQDAESLARLTNSHPPSLASLMDALVNWGAFGRNAQGQYTLTPFSQRLVGGTENAANIPLLLGWVGLSATYEAFGALEHTIRTGESAFKGRYGTSFHAYLAEHPQMGQLYDCAMQATAEGFAACAEAYDFSGAKLVVDVGGGQGAFAIEILNRYPGVKAISFDLPEVVATTNNDGQPASDRLAFVGGDAFESVPTGGDIYLTSTVLRCFADPDCLRVLKNIRKAMSPNSKLVAFEMLIPEQRDSLAMSTADLIARVVYGGRDRTEREYAGLFAQAGLRHTRSIRVNEVMFGLEAVPA